ncbi:MAG: LysR family transcriptional regulator [Gammaproteobacteria bacterium]|nr:LysR family transcriptional regulator [Gammaproteobacteria bacterium]MBT3725006.1 LysR family transcriptional regulator [Gammaproteobacteria bacterium]MBT4075069.1 LysR family transcriptional regulator [Gammaproteobacteria bacterium]MBT4193871.1 LysR family transcriptional regulator [Gammaproteobacteria bacterium]MBT4449717.1 LysR family transcriptional regulator [Gammaproteobacteria bacterium]
MPSSSAKIDISLLQTFHLVARTGSFSSAARELSISYQSVANQVRRLEQRYGAKLVLAEKGSRSISLSPQGKALHHSLGVELDNILARISVIMHDVHSVLRVGIPQALLIHFFPEILKKFRLSMPDIELSFYERDTILEDMILEGSLDVCISERFFGEASITQHLLGEYSLSLIYPREWVTGIEVLPDISFFSSKPFITYEPGQTIRSRAIDFLGGHFDEEPTSNTTASGSITITKLVEAGLGYAVVPDWCANDESQFVGKIILNELEPVKVYFGNTTFLEKNEYIILLREACKLVMKKNFI